MKLKEEALTREDRFHAQYYEAIIKELQAIRKLLEKEEKK